MKLVLSKKQIPKHLLRFFKPIGHKPKDEIDIPNMVCEALREAGWYRRQTIIWSKPNSMPESVQDRCSKSHEYIFLLSKSQRYFFDNFAIRENYAEKTKTAWGSSFGKGRDYGDGSGLIAAENWANTVETHQPHSSGKANKRSVWTVSTQPLKEAHFATFPPKLIEPMILAGTSEKGCCADCGSPYKRIVEKETDWQERKSNGASAGNLGQSNNYQNGVHSANNTHHQLGTISVKQLGWAKTCDCSTDEIKPCIVLDPFNGAGTTGLVSLKNNRSYIGIELNPEYIEISNKRLRNIQTKLF